jgi:bZIP factor
MSDRNDAFVVLSRTPGWWMVQRDSWKCGRSRKHAGKQGWVPSGALLETTIPLARAVSEAMRARKFISWRLLVQSAEESTPILRSSIRSTSFAAVVLRDYYKKGEGEADLATGDLVKVYKRYNHWSYVGTLGSCCYLR